MARFKSVSHILFSTIFFLLLSVNTNAQIGQRIKQRIKESTERKIEDKIVNKTEEKADQALDSLFKPRKKTRTASDPNENSNDSAKSKSSGFNFEGFTNATYESAYTLDMEFKVEIKSREKPRKKVETANMDIFYGENCYMMILQDEKYENVSRALMDLKNNTSIVLNDEDMSGVAISMDFMTNIMTETANEYQDSISEDPNYSFTRTGNTKNIAGYNCEEYIVETDEVKMNVWFTDEITIEMYQSLDEFPMFGSFSSSISYASQGQLQGTMMESHMVEKTGDKGTFDYLVKEVNLETTTLNMSDYTFMSM